MISEDECSLLTHLFLRCILKSEQVVLKGDLYLLLQQSMLFDHLFAVLTQILDGLLVNQIQKSLWIRNEATATQQQQTHSSTVT